MRRFYLASHDCVSSPMPRECTLVRSIRTTDGRTLHEVTITPPLPGQLADIEGDLMTVFLAFCSSRTSFDDVGKKPVTVYIFHVRFPEHGNPASENLVKLGVGTLHADLSEAERFAPLE